MTVLPIKYQQLQIIDAKIYVSVVTLSTQNYAKLLQQLKSGI